MPMLTIEQIAVHHLPREAFAGVQANERNTGYAHMIAPGAKFVLPRGRGRIDADEAARLARTCKVALPIAPAGQSLSDLASAAVGELEHCVDCQVLRETTHIVVAQSTLNERIVESVAGRVQCELGLKVVLPLALGQCGTLGLYAAMPLADGLLAGGGQILFVAADKWLYPFFRTYGDLVSYGDAAGALLMRRDHARGGTCVLGSALVYGDAIDAPWDLDPRELERKLVALAVEVSADALQQADLRVSQLDCFAPAGFGARFRAAIADELGIDAQRVFARDDGVHLSSADTLSTLHRIQTMLAPGESRVTLLCDAAIAGMAGALVVELKGRAPVPLH
ncbi:3-oxoacyl-[acyl-carrier-protein] synthase III [Trinickia symbiotica]|uniref:3-oxoacyl-ACP synthase n=2 Tax=Trinickia symbiotica TaxID=863227 RepID=A0A2N7XA45_9BURK|nr:hypothetical protein [Trinickia symbiotica]PMS38412.1 3-oxoacyl-ACP synthase [Trinickia symbiotica]PPK46420.1 3-oxoacyl-[acyl-carrier-protein] synthase III [Trinickia symbiotica]